MSSGSVCGVSWDYYVCGIQSDLLCVWNSVGSSMCVEFSRIPHPFKTRISHIQPSRNIPPIYSLHTCTHLSTHLSQRDNNSQFHTNNRVTEYRSHSTITNACIIYISHLVALTVAQQLGCRLQSTLFQGAQIYLNAVVSANRCLRLLHVSCEALCSITHTMRTSASCFSINEAPSRSSASVLCQISPLLLS